jgi:RimJ/RimL family protein N-acetyltransferase
MPDFREYGTTIKNYDRDFIEWHCGRQYYSLWAVEVEEPSWLKNVERARKYLGPYLLSGCHRQPHITIYTCGFVDKGDAYREMLEEQIKLIKASNLRQFPIHLVGLNSFNSSPYFTIEDPTHAFTRIRGILSNTVLEERIEEYVPHITVGLYNDCYPTIELAERLDGFEKSHTSSVEVTKLSFFTYKTNSICSPLEKQFHIRLKDEAGSPLTSGVLLRDVMEDDLPIFFEHQLDPAANHMAAFTSKDPADRDAFTAHWIRILADDTITVKTILFGGQVAGHVVGFERFGKPEVSYWIGKEYWGQGIATQALSEFLGYLEARPLYARAAKDNIASIRVLKKCGFTISGEDRGFANARGGEVEEYILELR